MLRLARTLVRRPGIALAILSVVTVVFAAFLPGIKLRTDTASFAPEDDPVIRELVEAVQDFGSFDTMMVVLKGDVFTPGTLAKVARLAEQISQVPGVEEVMCPLDVQLIRGDEYGLQICPVAEGVPETPEEIEAFRKALAESPQGSAMVARDGEAMAIFVTLEPDIMATMKAQDLAREIDKLARREAGPEEIYIVGEAYMGYVAAQNMRRDLRFLFPLALLVVIGALYASFGSVFDVSALLLGIVMSIIWTMGLMTAMGYDITMVSMILPIILVSMGSAPGIHILNRFHEERRSGLTVDEAIAKVMSELMSPISMTALTTAVGFASFVTSFIPPVREFGAFAAIGIMLNMIISLVCIPAVLVIRGRRFAKEAPAGPKSQVRAPSLLQRALDVVGRYIISHHSVIITAAVLVVVAFAFGIPRLSIETNIMQYFRKDSPVVKGTQLVEDYFGGTVGISVVVDSGKENGIKEPSVLNRMVTLEDKIASVDRLSRPNSIADLIRQVNRALHGDDPAYYTIPGSPEAVAQELLLFTMQGGSGLDSMVSYDFRKALINTRVANLPTSELEGVLASLEAQVDNVFSGTGITAKVVGLSKVVLRLVDRFMESQVKSLIVSMVGVWIVVSIIMGSVTLGLLCLIPLCISVAVNFGLMGYLGIPLDVVTIMISGICIGIGIDYSIHLVSRYRHELRGGMGKADALLRSIGSTGRGIFFNAATLILGFGLLAFSRFGAISVFGWLVAGTMFTSALGALIVIPAVLCLVDVGVVIGMKRISTKEVGAAEARGK